MPAWSSTTTTTATLCSGRCTRGDAPSLMTWRSRTRCGRRGNMGSACVWFVLDEMRRWSAAEGRRTTGEGCDWGALFGFGPGLTLDTVLLRSAPI
ncbi:hypothetical protein EJB05_26999, partial [Eragrostis curvula]